MAHDPCSECGQDNRLTVCAECMQDAETERNKSEQALDTAVECAECHNDGDDAGMVCAACAVRALTCFGCSEEQDMGSMYCEACWAAEPDGTTGLREALADLLALFDDIPDATLTDLGGAQRIDYILAIDQARKILV